MHHFSSICSPWGESYPPEFRLLFHYLTKKVCYLIEKFSIGRMFFFFINFEILKEKKKTGKNRSGLVNTNSCDTN